MGDEAKELALSMIRVYGDGAEDVALNHLKIHRRAGDDANAIVWAQVVKTIISHRDNPTRA